MLEFHARALGNALASPATGATQTVALSNQLFVNLVVYAIDKTGRRQAAQNLPCGHQLDLTDAVVGSYYVVTTFESGAFFTAIKITEGVSKIYMTSELLNEPNDIGPIPEPTQQRLVPPNSPSVLVAFGMAPGLTDVLVLREQYWNLLGDSFSLAPHEKRENSFTIVTGVQTTSSKQADVSTSLGVSANGGWGAISASVSSTVSASASFFQQVSVTSESTTYVSQTVNNDSTDSIMLLRWQLMDVVTVYDHARKPVSSIVTGGIVLVKSYALHSLEKGSERPPA